MRGEAMAKQRLAGCPAKHHDAWHVDVDEAHQEAMLSVLQWLKACLTGAPSMSGKYQNGYTKEADLHNLHERARRPAADADASAASAKHDGETPFQEEQG